ncbi:MAG: hypothetical protein A3F40_00130 [Chlamydiae bacterium RIFCSPHIGHO2_12_FULL_27_8]|nr:MAG: hypothetical protein A3F40_00130 [Chlamydiae bacterium RIFCSPHIGHO2_12_FULL_27_8]
MIKVFSKIEKIIFENMKAVETIEYWQKFFNGIVDENFEIDQSVDIEVHNEIKNFVSSLNEVIKDEKFHFEEIFYSLEEHLKNKTFSINKNQIGAIEFFSLKNFKQNKKIVFILGLDEKSDIYKKENSLNIIKLNDIANEQDNQRSSFLRVILLTENKLILSLENKNQSEYAFSIILKELLSYLDNNFLINNEKFSKLNIFYHPLLSIDKKYFSKGNRHFMKIYFEAAQKYYCNCPVLNKSKAVTNEIDTLIKISDIRKFLKNPIKYYFQNVLKIYLEEEIGDTELALSYLDKYKILEDTKDYELENILNFLEKKSHLPVGPFSQIEKENLKKQYDLQLENLNYLNLKKHDFFTIDFNSKVSDYEKSFDPIIIDIEGKSYVLTGSVENISYKGILQNSEMDYFNIFKNVLDISLVKDISDKFQNNLIFLKSKKIKTFSDINRNESLKNILIYYIKFSKRPSFLIHNWFNPILKNNRELLSKAVDNTFSYKDNFIDPYMKLYIDTFEKPELAEILNDLQRYVKPICDVFPEMK